MALTSSVQDTANPAPATTTASVFDRFFSNVTQIGGNYLTQLGQAEIAKKTGEAQQRLTSYSAVNPSLGAVNPAAAQLEADKTWVQRFLPTGSATVGAPGTSQSAEAQSNMIKWVILGLGGLLVVLVLIRVFSRK